MTARLTIDDFYISNDPPLQRGDIVLASVVRMPLRTRLTPAV